MLLLFCLGIILSACNQTTTLPIQATPGVSAVLTPYRTITSTRTHTVSTVKIEVPATPAPTATPFLYTIKKDDSMLAIAFKYGISLDELKAANPDVDPHFLSVGKQLVIPLKDELPQNIPTATPIPLDINSPTCYRTGDGGAWCIAAVKNELGSNVENLSGWIGIYDQDGKNIAGKTIFTPLNLVESGATIPLMAYFESPLPSQIIAQVELLSAITVAEDDPRYLDTQVQVDQTEISSDGRSAAVKGQVLLPAENPTASQLWVLAVAYDQAGGIVGARKWESQGETKFDVTVYSLGAAVDHVEVLAEARP